MSDLGRLVDLFKRARSLTGPEDSELGSGLAEMDAGFPVEFGEAVQ